MLTDGTGPTTMCMHTLYANDTNLNTATTHLINQTENAIKIPGGMAKGERTFLRALNVPFNP